MTPVGRALERALTREIAAGRIPGATAVVERGTERTELALGLRDPALPESAMRIDDVFRLASMTKPVVSVAALTLAEEGRLELAEPIATYLPAYADLRVGDERRVPKRPPTVHDLFRHTAGFSYGIFADTPPERAYREAGILDPRRSGDEFDAALAALPLVHEPGEVFEYSVASDVLGRVVEAVADAPLAEVLRERIFAPLGMERTAFTLDDPGRLAEGFAHGTEVGTLRSLHHPPFAQHYRRVSGGGALLGTAGDYARFCAMIRGSGTLDGARVLAPATVRWATAQHLPPGVRIAPLMALLGAAAPLPEYGTGFGLGFAVRLEAGRNPLPGSVGDLTWGGISGTQFWIDPALDLSVVVLAAAPDQRARLRRLVRSVVYAALD